MEKRRKEKGCITKRYKIAELIPAKKTIVKMKDLI
jgi:hypothetical protein